MSRGLTVRYDPPDLSRQSRRKHSCSAAAVASGLIPAHGAKHLGATVSGNRRAEMRGKARKAHGLRPPIVYTREDLWSGW